MKKIITYLSLLLAMISISNAEEFAWRNLGSALPQSQQTVNLTDIDVVGDSIWVCSGFASSFNQLKGEIYFSADGGKTFSIQNTLYGIHAIKMINSKLGYCTGMEGQVYKTTNGGELWSRIGSTSSTNSSIDFPPGSDTGYVGGFGGVLKKITPDGLVGIGSETSNDIRSISCPSSDHVYILWWADCNFYDGVNPVVMQEVSVGSTLPLSFLDIYMLNDTVGWISGAYGLIAKTTTGGWNLSEQHAYVGQTTPIDKDIYSIKFIDENHGAACGYGGNIIITNDGGNNWLLTGQGLATEMLLGMKYMPNGEIYVVGNSKQGCTPVVLKYEKISSVSDESDYPVYVYPNPASDEISIVNYSGAYKIYNSIGELIVSSFMETNERIILSQLNSGLYFISLGDKILKLIIE